TVQERGTTVVLLT
nr:immunoglobulin heavy chain junction region [Mus musculus]